MPSLIADPHALRYLEFEGWPKIKIAPVDEIHDPLVPRAIGTVALAKCLDSQLQRYRFAYKKTAFAVSCPIRDWQEFCVGSLKA
jgi:hypothetical protein